MEAGKQTPEAIRETAKQFESLFMKELLKSMRDATQKSGLLEGQDVLDTGQAMQAFGAEVERALLEFCVGQHLGHQAGVQRFRTGQRPSPQDHVDCPVAADTANQSRTSTPGRNAAQMKFRQPDLGTVLSCQPKVAGKW